jgi:hypothetical protein
MDETGSVAILEINGKIMNMVKAVKKDWKRRGNYLKNHLDLRQNRFCHLLGLGCPKQAFAKIATPRKVIACKICHLF